MKCLVSGATGFIGRQLCQRLTDRGNTVVPLSRSGAALADGRSTLAIDLGETGLPEEVLTGVEVVFHLAGIAHQTAPEDAYLEVNFRATMCLARQAAEAGVRSFVFLSSVKAMGQSATAEVRSEAQCSVPTEPYGASKWQAECELREQFADSEMAVIILRPTLVYGEKPRGNLQWLAAGVRRGLPRPPEGGGRSMVAVADLVGLLCLLAEKPPAGINTWIVSDGEIYSTRRLYDLLRAALGRGRGIGWLPRWGWRVGAWLLDAGRGGRSESSYNKLFGDERYSNAAVIAATGWRPTTRFEDRVDDMVSGEQGA